MNATGNLTRECNPLDLYSSNDTSMPEALLCVALVHCYCLIVFGTLGNALVLWCVATCTKTQRPMKVLLFNVFLPILVICLTTGPVIGEVGIALLTCDIYRISKIAFTITVNVYVFLVQIERVSIAAIAVIRAAAIGAPHRPMLGIRGAVVLVVVTYIYGIVISLTYMKVTGMGQEAGQQNVTSVTVLFLVTITLPTLITTAAYVYMISIIQRNNRGLVACQQQASTTTIMDQVTRAILAVFISNLVFGLPHAIYHLMGKQPVYMHVIFHGLFSTHFMVDPLAYMWFNSGCREKVLSSIRKVIQYMSSSNITTTVLQTGSTASCDQLKQQESSTHIQEDSNL